MKKFDIEIIVGLFMCLGILGLGYLSINLGQVDFLDSNYYPLKASFSSATGLQKDTNIEIAGVKIGKIKEITLENYEAVVTMLIDKNIKIQDDAIASIRTKGILGEQYIEILPGGSDIILKPNEAIFDTEPPFNLMTAIKGMVIDN
jgi:phospholipid/cholesterol/gamma-HCH transport system substrate-binding protein